MRKIGVLVLFVVLQSTLMGQTKKIASKNAGWLDGEISLTTLDNFGAIMISNEEFEEMKLQEEKEKKKAKLELKKQVLKKRAEELKNPKPILSTPSSTGTHPEVIFIQDTLILNPEAIRTYPDSVQFVDPSKKLKTNVIPSKNIKKEKQKSQMSFILIYVLIMLTLLNFYRKQTVVRRS